MTIDLKASHALCFLAAIVLPALCSTCRAAEVPVGRFGTASYGAWKATGTAFQKGPASGDLLTKLEIENASGAGVASSEIEGDQPMGTLTSPDFKISKRYVSFRIGGGDYEIHTCLNLLINGRVVRSATGWKSDRLVPMSWDTSRWMGQSAQVQLVDAASGDWGHINVDRIVQTDQPERPPVVTGFLRAADRRR